jgi:hypothetical protein
MQGTRFKDIKQADFDLGGRAALRLESRILYPGGRAGAELE